MARIRANKGAPKGTNPRRSLPDGQTSPTTDDAPSTPDVEAIPPVQRPKIRFTFDCEDSGEYAHVWKTQNGEDFQCQTSLPRDKKELLLQSCRTWFTSTPRDSAANPHGILEGNPTAEGGSPRTRGSELTLRFDREVQSKRKNEASAHGTICLPYLLRPASHRHDQNPLTADGLEDEDGGEDDVNEFDGLEFRYKTITVGDRDSITDFFDEQLRQIGQICLKKILKAWIREIHPQKQAKHPYNGGKTKEEAITLFGPKHKGKLTMPPWWPHGLRHCEPDHQSKQERLELAQHVLRYPTFTSERLRKSTTDIASSLEERFREPVTKSLSHIYDTRETEERYERDEISGEVEFPILVSEPRERKPRACRKIPVKSEKAPARRGKKPERKTRKRNLPRPSNPNPASASTPSHDSYDPNRDVGEPFQAGRSLPVFNYGDAGVNEYHHVGPLNAESTEQSYFPTVDMGGDNQAYRHNVPLMPEFPGMEGVFVNQTVGFNAPSHFTPIVPPQHFCKSERTEPRQVPLSSTNSLGHNSDVQTTPAGFSSAAYGSAAERCPHGIPRNRQLLCVHCQVYSPTPTTCTLDVPYSSGPFSNDDSTWEMVGLEYATDPSMPIPQYHPSVPE